ncbi:MAG: efflux RND transporter permease subunit [Nitrospinota bacterium]
MKKIIAYFAENDVAANLLMVILILSGMYAGFFGIKREVFPEFSADIVTVTVLYPGAAPEEVESGVTVRIEEEISGIDGIEELTSVSSEGVSSVNAELVAGSDNQKVLEDIKSAVDSIVTLPLNAERPIVSEVTNRNHVINVAVFGMADEKELKEITELVADDLLEIEGITQVEVSGVRPYEISIELSTAALRRYDITFSEVADAISRSSLDLPSGSLKSEGGEILVRTVEQAYVKEDFESIPLLSTSAGQLVTVGDVADVIDGFEDNGKSTKFDSKNAALIEVSRVGDQDVLKIASSVKDYLKNNSGKYSDKIEFVTWRDRTEILKSRMSLLLRNGINGLILVFIVLSLFLKIRLAAWVMIGIPVSFLGALMTMSMIDISLNMVSLFALILVLGLVVDDAVVIAENIYSRQQRDGVSVETSTRGTIAVSTPVIFGVLTTVAAFAPLLIVDGNMGKIMSVIPAVVIPTLFFSLVESQLILPSHLAHIHHGKEWKIFSLLEARLAPALDRFINNYYMPVLKQAVKYRALTVAIFIFLLLTTVGAVLGGRLQFLFFPELESNNIIVGLTMPTGTRAKITEGVLKHIESVGKEVLDELAEEKNGGKPLYEHILLAVGSNSKSGTPASPSSGSSSNQSHLGSINIQLVESEEREIGSEEIGIKWRETLGAIPEAEELTFDTSLFETGEAINVQLTGHRFEELDKATSELKDKLATYQGALPCFPCLSPTPPLLSIFLVTSSHPSLPPSFP